MKCTGVCCKKFYVALDQETLKGYGEREGGDAHILEDMLVYTGESVEINQGTAYQFTSWYYTCNRWDESTGRCTRYNERPDMCRNYPDYGRMAGTCEYCGAVDAYDASAVPGKQLGYSNEWGVTVNV